jgi:hypothetical protein
VTEAECSATAEPKDTTKEAKRSPGLASTRTLTKDIPSTPAGRLELPDLISMGDVRRAVQDVSPEDRIEWDQYSSNSSIGIRKAIKRARSSSPISSPAAKTPGRFNNKGDSLQPPVDPGSELWGRYSLNGSTPQGHTIPVLAHLMHTSSPRLSKNGTSPRSTPGFRRANSCGNQFPKRRRMGGPDEDVFTESMSLGPSKLSVLIERVHEGLAQPKQPHNEVKCSDSSIVSGELCFGSEESCVPIQDVSSEEIKKVPDNVIYGPRLQPEQADKVLDIHPLHSDGSDYGEFDYDDLDDATLVGVIAERNEPSFVLPDAAQADMPSEAHLQVLPPAKAELRHVQLVNIHQDAGFSTLGAEDNEFDDSDEESFEANLENIVAKFENQRPTEAKVLSVSKSQEGTTVWETDSDDEFGDGGFDDLDFEIAEAAATQSKQHKTNSLLPVRTKFP